MCSVAKLKNMPLNRMLLFIAAASAVILGAALVAQYGFHLHPCELCMAQRYPYMAIIIVGLAGAYLLRSQRARWWALLLCALLLLTDAGIAAYHSGVEAGVFKAPDACSSPVAGREQTLEEMRAAIMNAPLVTCSQAMAHFFGLSMASWNAMAALGLFIIAVVRLCAARRDA